MNIDVSKIGSIIAEALEEKLIEALRAEKYYSEEMGTDIINATAAYNAVRRVLGTEEEK
jgi:hypothetical protein